MHATAARTPRRFSGLVQTIAIVATLLLGVVALNWPITFATAETTTTNPAAAQVANGSTDNATDTTTTVSSSAADVAATANPAVVTITNYQPERNPYTNEPGNGQAVPYGVGSGYIIDESGHIVTNNHVTSGGTAFTVQLYDGTTLDATLVGADPFQDVAVLKLDLKAGEKVPGVLSFADSDTVRAGDDVIAIGTPYGEFYNSVSEGSISAVDRALDTGDGYNLPNLLQHSAPIYEGNSGGPLLNMAGKVIGMNVAKVTRGQNELASNDQTGIGFAIESDAVKTLVDQIIANGKVSRAYLGIESRATTAGQGVETVVADGPGAEAGLQAGDIITGLDGQKIDATHPFLNMLIFDHAPGDKVDLTVQRGTQELTITVTLGERPADLV